MSWILKASGLVIASSLLSGCSVFYPNWGATSLPEEPTQSVTETEQPTDEPSETPVETESAAPTEEPTEEPKPEPKKTTVEIIMAVVEEDFGVLTVVAQMPEISDEGGSCEFRFQAGNFEKKLSVKAEPSSDYTQCFPIEVPLSDLQSGDGIVTVSYRSDNYIGTSAASSVVIP